jgi:hypothetical protein
MMNKAIPEWCEHIDHEESHKYRLGKRNYCNMCDLERLDAEVDTLRTQIAEGDREFLRVEKQLATAREALERIADKTFDANERNAPNELVLNQIAIKALTEMEE